MPDQSNANSIEPWPLHHVQTALWFLAASSREQREYLPPPFPALLFHGHEGDFTTGNPLYFMVAFCAEACRQGGDIDRWMDGDPTGAIEQRFRELEAILIEMHNEMLRRSDSGFPDFIDSVPHFGRLLDATRRYADAIIGELGWRADVASPRLSARALLDEYSYGAYSTSKAGGQPPTL